MPDITAVSHAIELGSVIILLAIIATGLIYFCRLGARSLAGLIAIAGIGFRAAAVLYSPRNYSDVLAHSLEGATMILAGKNPYTTPHSVGPLNAFVYPPLEPLFYAAFLHVDPRWAEVLSGTILLLLFFWMTIQSKTPNGLVLLSLYSLSPLLAVLTGASTNDISAALFPVMGMYLISQNPGQAKFILANVLFGLGAGFKQFGVFPALFSVAFLWRLRADWVKATITLASTFIAVILPFLILSPLQLIYQVFLFHVTTRAIEPRYVLGALNPAVFGPYFTAIQFTVLASCSILLILKTRTWAECQIAWTTAMLVFLLLGRYFAPSYFAYILPFWILAGYLSEKDHSSRLSRGENPKRNPLPIGSNEKMAARTNFSSVV